MAGSRRFNRRRHAETRPRLARWLARGLLAASSAASCLCAGSALKAPPSPSPPATSTAPAPAATPVAVTPESLAGNWLFEMTRGGEPVQFSLHFAVDDGVLAGSLTGPDGNARELSKIGLHEDKVSWDVAGDALTLHYEGTVSGTSMKGTVKRSGGRGSRSGGGEPGEGAEGSSGGGGYSGGGGFHGGGLHGHGHRPGARGSTQGMTWSAYKSVVPAGETASPEPTTTPAASGRS